MFQMVCCQQWKEYEHLFAAINPIHEGEQGVADYIVRICS